MSAVGKYEYSAFSSDITNGKPRPVPVLTTFCYDELLERL
jgi:hypothetical protein